MDELQAVLEASPDAVLVVDATGVIQLANRNVEDTLGYRPAEIEGRPVEDLLPAADREDHVTYRKEYMEHPVPRPMGSELDLYALRKDGRRVPVEIGLGPVRREGALYVVATVTDITKRKRREQQLERQNERLQEFASIVSHDLRNPLNVASGYLELAREESDSDNLETVAAAHERMNDLIDDLLTLARHGETVTEVGPVDLARCVRDCWCNVRTPSANLDVTTTQVIEADENRLHQLLENLIRNAVEHGGTDVTVTVGDLVGGFYVADDGVGIPESRRERVFQTGYTTDPDGTGFGLNIVRDIANAHGWTVDVRESDGGGAKFNITGVVTVEDR